MFPPGPVSAGDGIELYWIGGVMIPQDLEIGHVYRIAHERKGHFTAQLIDIVDTPEGDDKDDVFLTVKIDVRAGTDQFRMRTASKQSRAGDVRISNLRPSLIFQMRETEEGGWLRDVVIPEQKEEPKGLFNKLRDLLD